MGVPQAIIAGALIIAAVIAVVFRWEIASPGIMRLDRWTGAVVLCDAGNERPAKANCEAR
jgi:hypothetical protein